MIYFLTIWLDTAHLISPVALAWSNPVARRKMLEKWWKFVALAGIALLVPAWIGWNAPNLNDPSLKAVTGLYFWWNLFHFAAQNYGVCRMIGYDKTWQTDLVMICTIVPGLFLSFGMNTWGIALAGSVVSLLHWTTDIALCSKTSNRWRLFGGAVLFAGLGGLLFPALSTPSFAPFLFGLRNGLGFVHFLYSRWVWRRGRELLGAEHGNAF